MVKKKSQPDSSAPTVYHAPDDRPGAGRQDMRDLVDGFISHSLSRREFVQSLAALGVSATGIAVTIDAAEAVAAGGPGPGQQLTGTGGELLVEQMKAAGVRYMFTNPGSFEVGLLRRIPRSAHAAYRGPPRRHRHLHGGWLQ